MDNKERLIALMVSWNEHPVATVQEQVEIIAAANLLAPQWMSVKERLPEQDQLVLVWDSARKLRLVCHYLGANFWFDDPERRELRSYSIGTTQWQPIPAAPKDNHDD